jgi:hypothetical protein
MESAAQIFVPTFISNKLPSVFFSSSLFSPIISEIYCFIRVRTRIYKPLIIKYRQSYLSFITSALGVKNTFATKTKSNKEIKL